MRIRSTNLLSDEVGAGDIGARILHKGIVYLYAYPVILNIFVVPDDAQRLVKSQ